MNLSRDNKRQSQTLLRVLRMEVSETFLRVLRREVSQSSENDMLASMKDYTGWLTKAQAAEAIGVSTKTVEKMADEKHLQRGMWKRPTGGAAIAVYHPGDVERIRKERNPDAPPFVLPSVSEASESSQNTAMVHVPKSTSEAMPALALLVEAIRTATPNSPSIDKKLYLTLEEAASYSGLPKTYLHRLIVEEKLKAIKAGGWRIRRSDLEQI